MYTQELVRIFANKFYPCEVRIIVHFFSYHVYIDDSQNSTIFSVADTHSRKEIRSVGPKMFKVTSNNLLELRENKTIL